MTQAALHTTFAPYIVLIHQLLELLARTALEREELGTEAFRETLERYREQLGQAHADEDVEAIIEPCLRSCEAYLMRARSYLTGCEEELAEVLSLLRRAVESLSGESSEFDAKLRGSTERLTQIVQLEDIDS